MGRENDEFICGHVLRYLLSAIYKCQACSEKDRTPEHFQISDKEEAEEQLCFGVRITKNEIFKERVVRSVT